MEQIKYTCFTFILLVIFACNNSSDDSKNNNEDINSKSNSSILQSNPSNNPSANLTNYFIADEEQFNNKFWLPITDSLSLIRNCPPETFGTIETVVVNNANTFICSVDQSRKRCADIDNQFDKLFRSIDNGKSWEEITSRIPLIEKKYETSTGARNSMNFGSFRLYVSKKDFYVSVKLYDTQILAKSEDNGSSWTIITKDIEGDLIITQCGEIYRDNMLTSNSTFIHNGSQLHNQIRHKWDYNNKQWVAVKKSEVIKSTQYKTQEFIFSKLNSNNILQEHERIKQYKSKASGNPLAYKVNPNKKFHYEKSSNKGKSWTEVQLPYDQRYWVRPWNKDIRERIDVDNILSVRDANNTGWKPLYRYKYKEDAILIFPFTVGGDNYGYVTHSGKIFKSVVPIYEKLDCE